MTDWEIVAGAPVFRTMIKFNVITNKISSIKAKRNPRLKKQITGVATHNDFFLKNLALDVALKIPTSMCHCILLIGIISNGHPYKWTLITIVNVK